MRLFQCQSCGNAVHFDNTACVECGHRLGYLPEAEVVTAVEPEGDSWRALADPQRRYLFCDNAAYDSCNWLVPADGGHGLCPSCRHNHRVPDLGIAENLTAWRRIEAAKRQLFYSLMRWHLPLETRIEDPDGGLAFDFLAPIAGEPKVLTGQDNGLITLDIGEAHDAEREARRTAMGEPYRTLLGHFRHEIGHYYWDRLVRDAPAVLARCRALFGDERADYGEALARHYAAGAPADWPGRFISAYASCHPWEDFAETWAHYIHMVDALETAHAFGLVVRPRLRGTAALEAAVGFDPYTSGDLDDLVAAFVPVTVALNSVNRSLGQPDLYPFVLPGAVLDKLRFIHDLIRGAHESA